MAPRQFQARVQRSPWSTADSREVSTQEIQTESRVTRPVSPVYRLLNRATTTRNGKTAHRSPKKETHTRAERLVESVTKLHSFL